MKEFWSPRIRDMIPYTPGEQPQGQPFIKLNTNENPYPPSPRVLEAVRQAAAGSLRLYPDPESAALRDAVAGRYGLKREQVFAGNGSDEVLAICFQAFFDPERTILFPDVTYSFYPVFAGLYGLSWREVPLDEQFRVHVSDYRGSGGVVLPNPNAPTGLGLPLEDIQALLESNPRSVVLIDEAYVDFGAASAAALVGRYPNLVVVQTLSKSRSLAGLRVGFALADADLIAALECVKNSFNSYPLDRLAQAGALAALEDRDYFQQTTEQIIRTRDTVIPRLRALGFQCLPSSANFLFLRHPGTPAKVLLDGLRERGILVRWWDKPRISDYLRVTVGTREEMRALCQALAELTAGR